MQPITEVSAENLTFHYREQDMDILRNLEMHLGTGVHLLKGPSGCGKSTFLRILAGELPVQEGCIGFGPLKVTADADLDVSDYVEYMAQEPVVICGTVEQNILLGQSLDSKRLAQAMERADLNGLLQKLPSGAETPVSPKSLSSGEKQKIALARAFYHERQVWILDEPTSALDPSAIEKIMKSILEYGRERIVILSSHQMLEGFPMKVHLFGEEDA